MGWFSGEIYCTFMASDLASGLKGTAVILLKYESYASMLLSELAAAVNTATAVYKRNGKDKSNPNPNLSSSCSTLDVIYNS